MGFSLVPPAAMLAAQIILSFASIVAPVLAPVAAPDLGADAELVGLHVAVVYAFSALSSLLSGGFIRRFGPLRIVQATLVLLALAAAMAALGTLAAVMLAAAILGLAYGPMTPSSSQILQRTTPPERVNIVFSIKQTGVPAGTFLAGLVLPALAALAGWRTALAALAAVALALAAALQPLRAELDAGRDPGRPLFRMTQLVALLRQTVAAKAVWEITVVSMVYTGMQQALAAFMVVYLNTRLGLPLVAAGAMLSASQAAGAIGRIAWGVLADRLGRPRFVLALLGFVMTVSALAAGAFSPQWPSAAIAAVCIAFGGSATGWNGVYLAQIARLAPPGHAGEVTGASNFFGFSGVVMMPAVFSAILAASGSYAVGYAVIAAGTLACALTLLRERA